MPAKRRFAHPQQHLTSLVITRVACRVSTDVKKIGVNLSIYVGFSMLPARKHLTEARPVVFAPPTSLLRGHPAGSRFRKAANPGALRGARLSPHSVPDHREA
ncbi:hypothetical protein [Bosea vaviloviae]|uniref:hypothetical protein n=1 Tax=Bosea vaviloviae TaxID=1526658 RepID=UPI0011DF6197|nr:hypothetical protein [Bosea vaviloviae]